MLCLLKCLQSKCEKLGVRRHVEYTEKSKFSKLFNFFVSPKSCCNGRKDKYPQKKPMITRQTYGVIS